MTKYAPAPSAAKRIVTVDPEGRFTILGALDEPLPILINMPEETEVTPATPNGLKIVTFNLVRVKPRFALYKLIQVPETSRFNDTFDPAQV